MYFLLDLIRNFFKLRSISINYNLSFSSLSFSPLELLGWNFAFYKKNQFLGQVSIDNLRNHKRNMKMIIKNSFGSNFFIVLSRINNLVLDWINTYSCSDFFFDTESNLDVYLFKLLWNWAKRRHPRRPNTWIYLKYWKYFAIDKKWNFFFIDFSTGRCLFLLLHTNYSSSNVYRIPSSMNVFDISFFTKLGLIWMKKMGTFLSGFYLILWKRQSGKCYICNKLFLKMGFNNIKILNFKNNRLLFYSFRLVHKFCLFYLKIYYLFFFYFYDES